MPRILIVDDSRTDRVLAKGLLKQLESGTVREAADGQEAADALAGIDWGDGEEPAPPDLILTDMQMPNRDGLGLVEEVKAKAPHVPIILMTSAGSEELAVRALQAGASSYVNKRDLRTLLRSTVEGLLSNAGQAKQDARLMDRQTAEVRSFELENDVSLVAPAVRIAREMVADCGAFEESDRLRLGVALEEAVTNAIYHGNLELDSDLRDRDDGGFYELGRQRAAADPWRRRRVRVRISVDRAPGPPDDAGRARRCEARFRVSDDGNGFDPESLPDPTDPENLARAHGRGLLLIRTFMDDVIFEDGGSSITLVKRSRS